MEAGKLFDQVDLAGDVAPPAGHGHLPGLAGAVRRPGGETLRWLPPRYSEAERGKNPLDACLRDGLPQHAQDFARAQLNLGRLPAPRINVNGAGEQLAARELEEDLGAAPRRAQRGFDVHPALEAVARFGAQPELFGRAPRRNGVEPGRLEQDVLRAQADFRVGAAHDAGERHGALGVGDDQVVGLQGTGHPVERGQLLAGLGGADDDFLFRQRVEVEGVRGVAELEQDVVGDVHDVVDGSDPAGFEALPQPVGRGLDFHVAQHQRHVAVAEVGRGNLDPGRLTRPLRRLLWPGVRGLWAPRRGPAPPRRRSPRSLSATRAELSWQKQYRAPGVWYAGHFLRPNVKMSGTPTSRPGTASIRNVPASRPQTNS